MARVRIRESYLGPGTIQHLCHVKGELSQDMTYVSTHVASVVEHNYLDLW